MVEINKINREVIFIVLSIIALIIWISITFQPKYNVLKIENSPCYYYVTNDTIKLHGIDDNPAHDIQVLTNEERQEIILLDFITEPPTEIPRCDLSLTEKVESINGTKINKLWIDENCEDLNFTFVCGNYLVTEDGE